MLLEDEESFQLIASAITAAQAALDTVKAVLAHVEKSKRRAERQREVEMELEFGRSQQRRDPKKKASDSPHSEYF